MAQDQYILPLTEFQYSIWKGQKLRPEDPLYNMAFTFDIFGDINVDIFKEAFEQLASISTNLQLVVDETEPENPCQKFVHMPPQLVFLDLTNHPNFNIEQWLNEKSTLLFNLQERSYYSAIIKKSEKHFIWYLNQHHIFTDAYCFQLLFNRLVSIYKSKIEGQAIELSLDFEDYAESCIKKSRKLAPVKSDHSAVFPTNYSIYGEVFKNPNTSRSKRIEWVLPTNKLEEIKAALHSLGLRTLSLNLDILSYLISTLLITIKKVGVEDDTIDISNIFSERVSKKSKTLIKPLLRILHGKIDFSTSTTFVSLYKQVYAFLIMREGSSTTEANVLPASIINFFNLEIASFLDYKTEYKWHHCHHMDAHHFLRCHIFRYTKDAPFTLAFDLKDIQFQDKILAKLQKHYMQVIDHFLLEKNQHSIENLCLLSLQEREVLNDQIEAASTIKTKEEDLFINAFLRQVQLSPDAIALRCASDQISYAQLYKRAKNIAIEIQKIKSEEQIRVAIHLERSLDFVYSVIACLLSGASFTPIPISLPKQRKSYMIKDIAAHLVFSNTPIDNIDLPTHTVAKALENPSHTDFVAQAGDVFYTLYTSGSTGKPKGVVVTQQSFTSYLEAIKDKYLLPGSSYHMPLFTATGFDLTMTSLFLPLYTGGSIKIFEEKEGLDLSIQEVIQDKEINCLKCTPSHLKLVAGLTVSPSISSILVGGENFTRATAMNLTKDANHEIQIFNEYGPTEATVGCIVHPFNRDTYIQDSNVPIGTCLSNSHAVIVDAFDNPLPQGVIGELCIVGAGLAKRYQNDVALTKKKFLDANLHFKGRYYKTGDFARRNFNGDFEYFGRRDDQIKVQGVRIEKAEIETVISKVDSIKQCVVAVKKKKDLTTSDYIHCKSCGLPSNYPSADFDDTNVCSYCRNYETYKTKVEKYFESEATFEQIFETTKPHEGTYDCIMLYSGGKDSSYALGKLIEKGYRVLAFTLDNGYISAEAKANINRIVSRLGVDHMYGETEAMNEIFVDSLQTHCNVCNGCFKTIYNLSLKIAYQQKIPIIVTGLSRGQFFETKLSEEIFWKPMENVEEIDRILFEAREAYHGVKDAVYKLTDGKFIEEHNVLQKVKIVDFYRYHDVTLEQLLHYISTKLPWVRPEDTGRSTNCLINKAGIYIHKQQKGFSNYAFPYSWDVRTGHKTMEETVDEIEEYIDPKEVLQILDEIGFANEEATDQLVLFYTGQKTDDQLLRDYCNTDLPNYMIPSKFIHIDEIPLTQNGKVDLKKLLADEAAISKEIIKPANALEEILVSIWAEVMKLQTISTDDDFFHLGGTSLEAIRMVARIENEIDYKLPVNYIFQYTSIQSLASYILEDMQAQLSAE